jgi:hypothetical protein
VSLCSIELTILVNSAVQTRRRRILPVFLDINWHNNTQRYYSQYNDIQYNDIQHNDIQYNDIQHNDTRHNDTQHNGNQHNNTFSVIYAEFHLCWESFMLTGMSEGFWININSSALLRGVHGGSLLMCCTYYWNLNK